MELTTTRMELTTARLRCVTKRTHWQPTLGYVIVALTDDAGQHVRFHSWVAPMPIFRFVAVAAAILLALLFVADATFAPRGPLFTNESEGLPRSQPIRPEVAERPREVARPRAPVLVEVTSEQPAAANPVAAATIKAPPLAAFAETSGTVAAGTQDRAQSAKTEPARPEPARVATAELEAVGTEASKREYKRNAATTRAIKAAPKLKTRKQVARKSERGGRYATYRDDVPAVENGYAGAPFRREWPEWQQRPRGGEFHENPFRF